MSLSATQAPPLAGALPGPAIRVPPPRAWPARVPEVRKRWNPRGLARGPWPLLAVLVVQAYLSVRLLQANTAFTDEALYLWAGHLEWAHVLHGTPLPSFPTFFSGAPVIYPPIGAVADSLGGLAGARALSLVFMLVTTTLLWDSARRLFGGLAAFFAAALFVSLGPVMHLGAFATYDAMALMLLALSAWFVVRSAGKRDGAGWLFMAAAALFLSNATKYATFLFDPIVISMAVLTGFPRPGGKQAIFRATWTAVIAGLLLLGGFTEIPYAEDSHTGLDMRYAGYQLVYLPIVLAAGVCPSAIDAFMRQQYRWCCGATSLIWTHHMWRVDMAWKSRLPYIAGWLWNLTTAMRTIVLPLIPIVLLAFLPGEIQLRNAILLIPVVVTGAILYPLWHNVRWRVHVWPLAIAVGWAQALAIWDYARGKVMSWDPSRSPKDATHRFRKAVFAWNGTLALLWVALATWRVEQSQSSRFAVVAVFGLVNLAIIVRVLFPGRDAA